MQRLQAVGDAGLVVGGDHAVGDVAQAVALDLHQAPAHEAKAGIDAEQTDHVASRSATASGRSKLA